MWNGDTLYLLRQLIAKDFRIRYRNMSLGMLWSIINPLVMMAVLTFVFTQVFGQGKITDYMVTVLCGLVPFNFFALAWLSGSSCIVENQNLVKRVPMPAEVLPLASVMATATHFVVQVGLVLAFTLILGRGVNWQWLWLPVVWGLELVFVCGLVLASSALNVFVRDVRYLVESANTVLFWLVPIFYPFEIIPASLRGVYELNPVAALVLALRRILIDARPPGTALLLKFAAVSVVAFAGGWFIFRAMKRRFYEYL
jgi:ABC-type polysaccharide/polyol phosphate export permease